MNRLADAYENAAEALAALALELRAPVPQEASGDVTEASWTETDDWDAPGALGPGDPGSLVKKPAGSAAVCPAHGTEYRDGKYGPYCPNTGTDPKWTNERGYCTLTPKNAAAYLRQKAGR